MWFFNISTYIGIYYVNIKPSYLTCPSSAHQLSYDNIRNYLFILKCTFVLVGFCQVFTNLDISRKRATQLKNSSIRLACEQDWGVFPLLMIAAWGPSSLWAVCHPWAHWVGKQVKKATGNKPLSSSMVSAWVPALTSLQEGLSTVNWNKPFRPKLFVIASIKH